MNRKVRIALALLLSLFSIIMMTGTAPSPEASYPIHTPYDYPIKPGTPEWAMLSTQSAKVEACQIPDDVLHALTTEALVETVLSYPLRTNLLAYDTKALGYQKLTLQFNGLQELERRADALSILSQRQALISMLDDGEKTFTEFFAEDLYFFLRDGATSRAGSPGALSP